MNDSNKSIPSFKIIQIIYGSLILGVIIMFKMFGFSNFTINIESIDYIMPLVFIGILLLSKYLFNTKMSQIKGSDSLFEKITKYQRANIMRGAPLEAFAIFAIFKGDIVFIIVTILIMLLYFPSKRKFEAKLPLTMQEKARLKEM